LSLVTWAATQEDVFLRAAISSLTRRRVFGGVVSEVTEISLFAAGYKTFRHRFQFLPPGANFPGFGLGDLIVVSGHGDDVEQVGEFLDDLIGGWNQEMRMRRVLRIKDEKAAGALANPLDEPVVPGALEQRLDAVEGIAGAAAGGVVRRFGPFVNHGKRQAEVGGDLFGSLFIEDLVQQFVGMHGGTMEKPGNIGKREASIYKLAGKL
jgi:hypothetical protein